MPRFHLTLQDTEGKIFSRTIKAECFYSALDRAHYYYGVVACLQYTISYPEA